MTLTVDEDAHNDRKTEALMDNRKVRILLVDDDEDDYVLTRELLTDIPDGCFELEWAPEPEAALQTMLRNQHDLCLIDYHLGCTNGLTLLREAMNLGSRMPMILLTGQGERAVDLGAMQAGAADFLEKGRLDSALLERSIRYTLQGKKHADELERKYVNGLRSWRWPTRPCKPRLPSALAPRMRSSPLIVARTSSWRPWPTSCVIR